MAEHERIVLSGFRFEIAHGKMREEGKAAPREVVVLTFNDDERRISVEAWFPAEAWEGFRQDVNGGVAVPTREAIERLGI